MKTQLSVCLMLGARAKKKVGFKLLSVGFIEKGIPLSTKVWSITMSPSNCTLCMFFHYYFCADDGSCIECVTEGVFFCCLDLFSFGKNVNFSLQLFKETQSKFRNEDVIKCM